ncbi:rhomboid family intramembrane serine protease [uncultured Pseudoalteromonas sp.]|uniref:rhomboid family intramembrane serine protease n=1 Tax=uncultured Pseudoalteromonas sp. TaxID=114053 RepID=UPI0026028A25|nr:rhomboid family intramembrane serine protease [uncultured Pseudoalteromonas sp.]
MFGAITGPDGIDYGAHIGGFMAGLIIGYLLKNKWLAGNRIIRLLNQGEAQLKR